MLKDNVQRCMKNIFSLSSAMTFFPVQDTVIRLDDLGHGSSAWTYPQRVQMPPDKLRDLTPCFLGSPLLTPSGWNDLKKSSPSLLEMYHIYFKRTGRLMVNPLITYKF